MLDKCDNGCGSAGWTLSKLSATDSRGAHALLAYPLVQSGANTFVPGQWYHIALVRQGSTASLYVNGVQIAQATGVGTIPSAQNPFLIGRRNGSQLLPVSGAIDEVGVWARALTSGEISALATPPPPGPPFIASLTPSRAIPGMQVTVQGSGFDQGTPPNNVVKINGVQAQVLQTTPAALTVRVPTGATTGPVTVTAPLGTGTSAQNLVIRSLGPNRTNVPTTDLLAYWTFDVDGSDGAGSWDLTLEGGLSLTTAGRIGSALNFPGNGNMVAARLQNDPVFNFGASDVSFALWVNWASVSGEQVMLDKCDSGCAAGGWTFTKLSPTDSRGGNALLAYPIVQSGANSLVTGQWYHVAVVRQGSTAQLYLNGVQIAQATGVGTIPTAMSPFLVGGRNGSQVLPMNGVIDEVGIWARALTAAEVAALATPP